MKIDTLILNGGGIVCCCYLGCIKYLFEEQHIPSDLSTIKQIYCVSGGMTYILPFLFGLSLEMTIEFFLKLDTTQIAPPDSLSIHSLLEDYGLFGNSFLKKISTHIMKHLKLDPELTLEGLYKLKPIELIVKVLNVSQMKDEYISYKNYPHMKVTDLLQMTTSIPFFFKSFRYKNDIYVDGGTSGSISCRNIESKNYLSMNTSFTNKKMENLFEYIPKVLSLLTDLDRHPIQRELFFKHPNITMIDFNIGLKEKKELIHIGYQTTKKHFKDLDTIPEVYPNHKQYQIYNVNSKVIISHKWKSISYHYLLYKNHQGINNS